MTKRETITPAPGTSTCFHCRAWRNWTTQAVAEAECGPVKDEPMGQCRIRAPLPGKREAFGDRPAVWPVVAASDWCLEFEGGRT